MTQQVPTSRDTLKEWCLRKLGKPVIQINVSDDQVDDRLDEAMQFFQDYHFDGVEKVYEVYQLTEADITNEYITIGGEGFSSPPDLYIGVVEILEATNAGGSGIFNLEYQLRLQDYAAFGSFSFGGNLLGYEMYQNNLSMLKELLVGVPNIRFNRHTDRLHIDWDWSIDATAGEYVIIVSYKIVDPNSFTDVYNDYFLKRYLTALIKEQWGSNLSKFQGVQLPGGVTMNGGEILQQAQAELATLREEMQSRFEVPVDFYMA